MNKFLSVIAIVEGSTEKRFIDTGFAQYLGELDIGIFQTPVSKAIMSDSPVLRKI